MSEWYVKILASITFFSRLPVSGLLPSGDKAFPKAAETVLFLPLVGCIIGLFPAIFLVILSNSALPSVVVAVIVLALLILITGALHEDGLADALDGLFGGSTPERRLHIMKDSRIGVYGAVGLCLSTLLRVTIITEMIDRSAIGAGLALLTSAGLSRSLMGVVWARLAAARTGGLSVAAGRPTMSASLISLAGSIVIALAFLFYFHSVLAILCSLIGAVIGAFAVERLAARLIGGQTGDILGACQQIAEIAFLCGLLMFSQ